VFVMAYSNVALSPDGGATWSLSRALPRQLVSEMLMAAERIGARRLHELGIVNRVTGTGGALTEALALAEILNDRAPNVLSSIKELMSEAAEATFNRQLASERDHFVRNLHHANAGIGIASFLAKQPPEYE
jgi:enoyl-CoA hydratase/carnithine racemase